MNGCVPDWDVEEDHRSFIDLPLTTHRTSSMMTDQDLTELVWQNGHVIMQSQNNRKNAAVVTESKQPNKPDLPQRCGGASANFNVFFEEEETAPWLQYALDDALDTEFCTEFFQGMPIVDSKLDASPSDRCPKPAAIEDVHLLEALAPKHSKSLHLDQSMMPPPKPPIVNSSLPKASCAGGIVNFSHFSRPLKLASGYPSCRSVERNVETNRNYQQVGDSSVASSKIFNNMDSYRSTQNQPEALQEVANVNSNSFTSPVEDVHKRAHVRGQLGTHDTTTVSSSSAGSGSSFGRSPCPIAASHKRKSRDVEESECQSEETEFQSIEVGKSARKSKVARRSRAAEVHNLSERRRRDRINEKMKALQELIPHCNKTDKASMLDEAIEYLKSLQLQVQMMWLGNGMAPMMFPGAQQYLSFMGTMPPITGAAQMPIVALESQTISSTSTTRKTAAVPSQSMSPTNYQNPGMSDAYLRYLGLQNMKSPQGLNFAPYYSQLMQPNCSTVSVTSSSLIDGTGPSENNRNG